jgi:hypothetical protein
MAGPIRKVALLKFRDAWYQLSREEVNNLLAKVNEAFEAAGGRNITMCSSAWASEQWQFFVVEEFPDIEAVQKYTGALIGINWFRYVDSMSVLGTEMERPVGG